jgi:hypothetical protein
MFYCNRIFISHGAHTLFFDIKNTQNGKTPKRNGENFFFIFPERLKSAIRQALLSCDNSEKPEIDIYIRDFGKRQVCLPD